MFQIKRIVSLCMATALVLSMTAFAANDDVAYGEYTVEVSHVTISTGEPSMTNGYALETAVPVTVSEAGYTLTLDFYNYYETLDAIVMEDLYFKNSNDEWVSVDFVDVNDEYDAEEHYKRAVVTVDSLESFQMKANMVAMAIAGGADSSVRPWLVSVDASTLSAVGASDHLMAVTATVAKNVSTSTVTIPESTDMGVLSKSEDTVVAYSVGIAQAYGQTVTVTADDTVTLTDGAASLAIANKFDGKNGTLTASATAVADVATDSNLSLSGALRFYITIA